MITEEQFNSLYEALDSSRKNSETIKVRRDALAAMLIEYSRIAAKVKTA